MSSEIKKPTKIFYGWWIVISGTTVNALATGTYWHGFGAFFDPIVDEFKWSRAITSIAPALQRGEGAAFGPFVGIAIEKFGPRNVMLFGIILCGIGFIAMAHTNSLLWFFVASSILTIGLTFGTFLVVSTAVANWFVQKRALALSAASTGSGFGGFLVPVIVLIISLIGWRDSLQYIGIAFFVIGIPCAMVMRSKPEDYGMFPDNIDPSDAKNKNIKKEREYGTKEALKSPTFWTFATVVGISQLMMSANVHLIPALTSFGFSREVAGLIIGVGVNITNFSGRILSGIFGDKINKKYILTFAFACQTVGLIIFSYSRTIFQLVFFMFFWGLGFGLSVPIRLAIVGDYFGRKNYGTILSLIMTVSAIYSVISPVAVGWGYDVLGNYRQPFLILALISSVSIPGMLLIKPMEKPKS
jgi:sugar phosphate permease|tara:strand:+ start:1168 stop:2409 length:1242 start_codon:yes stop_codon:yes gene_type:complete